MKGFSVDTVHAPVRRTVINGRHHGEERRILQTRPKHTLELFSICGLIHSTYILLLLSVHFALNSSYFNFGSFQVVSMKLNTIYVLKLVFSESHRASQGCILRPSSRPRRQFGIRPRNARPFKGKLSLAFKDRISRALAENCSEVLSCGNSLKVIQYTLEYIQYNIT